MDLIKVNFSPFGQWSLSITSENENEKKKKTSFLIFSGGFKKASDIKWLISMFLSQCWIELVQPVTDPGFKR